MLLPELIRIGLIQHAATLSLSLGSPGLVTDATGATRSVTPEKPVTLALRDGRLDMVLPDAPAGDEPWHPALPVTFTGQETFRWQGSDYRGRAEALADSRGLTLVDTLEPETYLRGVVPREVPSFWPMEALKVQAIAARTYLAATVGRFAAEGFDLHADERSQVYGGKGAEHPRTDEAVRTTAGIVATWQGAPIKAYYSSGAGGMTEANDAVDGFADKGTDGRPVGLPYLRPVVDFDWNSRRYAWSREVTDARIAEVLAQEPRPIGRPLAVEVAERSASGRVRWLRIRGTAGTAEIPGTRLRRLLRLDSTLFSVGLIGPGVFLFSGRGWGHGVGMSQSGARQMADWGFDHAEILAHYYPGTRLERADAPTP
jgi:stage II sporulation protein D